MPVVFQQVVACVEVAIKGQGVVNQNQLFNILNFQTPSATPTYSDVEAIVSIVDNWVSSVYKLNYSSDLAVVELRGKSLHDAVAPFFNLAVNYVGTQAGVDEWAQAPLVLLHGPLSSRHQAGRFYAFPPGNDQSQLGYTTVQMTNLINALTNLKVSAASAGYQLGIASRQLHTITAVNSISRSNRLTYQKRRRVSFGR